MKVNYTAEFMKAAITANLPQEMETVGEFLFYSGAKANHEAKKGNLTSYQSEYLSLILAPALNALHQDLQEMKAYVKFCWKRAEPGYIAGDEYFKELNRARNRLIKIKRKIKVLEGIQKTLKNAING